MSKAVVTTNQNGNALSARKRAERELYKTIEGLEWGEGAKVVKGSYFSPQTRHALAVFCHTTGANPMTHVDILRGKPYLNAQYWSERCVTHPLYLGHEQINISADAEEKYRELEERARDRNDTQARIRMGRKADQVAEYRIEFSPPDDATHAYVTLMRRLIPSAPLTKIKNGEITDLSPYTVTVAEANWAGGTRWPTEEEKKKGAKLRKYDPIGNADPEKTARTRSLRRAAIRTFSAWVAQVEEVKRAELMVEAEWEDVTAETVSEEQEEYDEHMGIQREAIKAPAPFDRQAARRRFFATMRGAGIPEGQRKQWAASRGYPESTSDWTEEDFDQAQVELISPIRDEVLSLCKDSGANLEEVSLRVIGRSMPEWASHWQDIRSHLLKEDIEL